MQGEPDYRDLLERVGDMIYTLDLEGRFTYVNAAGLALLGYDSAELLGMDFREVLEPSSAHVAAEHFARGIAGTEATPFFEVGVIRKDGTRVDVEVRAGSLIREGELVGRQGVARDISALKSLQAEVADKSERLALMEDKARTAMELYRRIADMPAPDASRTLAGATAHELGLDAQDVEIVALLAAGQSNREIGAAVHLSPNTVKDRVSKLMRALDARTRAEVVAKAARRGLVSG
jgi:PAS domain S-box-containing protein